MLLPFNLSQLKFAIGASQADVNRAIIDHLSRTRTFEHGICALGRFQQLPSLRQENSRV
jgi:hypothetical protein